LHSCSLQIGMTGNTYLILMQKNLRLSPFIKHL
jgi:hypothetical protein